MIIDHGGPLDGNGPPDPRPDRPDEDLERPTPRSARGAGAGVPLRGSPPPRRSSLGGDRPGDRPRRSRGLTSKGGVERTFWTAGSRYTRPVDMRKQYDGLYAYTRGLWPGLVRFLGDPKIPPDTNGVERAPRGVAVGRKNHYGSRSERGTWVAALLYSVIDSGKLAGVEPRTYPGEAARRAIRSPGVVTLARDLK